MGIVLMLLASLFVAISNLCMRRSIDAGGSSKGFLMIQLSIVFLIAILLNPVRTGDYAVSSCMLYFGCAGGVVLSVMMICFGKALEIGPPGLTSASLSSSTVMPALLMACVFGAKFGYIYNMLHALASLLVVAGLFWAGWGARGFAKKGSWASLVAGAFVLHTLFLVIMQWRALLINFPTENGLFLNFDVEGAKSTWFMPAVFCVAALVQIAVYFSSSQKMPRSKEVMYGFWGGMSNGLGTFLMIQATELATPLEQAMIFPIFSVGIVIFCNLWGRLLYAERVNWLASGLCVIGIIVGTVNWQGL